MITPNEFLQHNDYRAEDITTSSDAKNILKLLSCEEFCTTIVDKQELSEEN